MTIQNKVAYKSLFGGLFLLMILAVAFVQGVSADPEDKDTSGAPIPVTVGSNFFDPDPVTILAGDTVEWTNTSGFHNVVADDGSFRCANGCDGDGGDGNPSAALWTASVAFDTPGIIPYYCEIHGSAGGVGMSSVVNVGSSSLIIERFTYQATGVSEYITVKNVSGSPVDLSTYRIGDEETKGGGEGMFFLPSISLGAGSKIIIAGDADGWTHGGTPDYSFAANSEGVPVLTKDTSWATGTVALGNGGDEVILLNDNDKVFDGACYLSSACEVDDGTNPTQLIMLDGALPDLPSSEAGYKRLSDIDTNMQLDWVTNPTAVSLQAISATASNLSVVVFILVLIGLCSASLFVISRRRA